MSGEKRGAFSRYIILGGFTPIDPSHRRAYNPHTMDEQDDRRLALMDTMSDLAEMDISRDMKELIERGLINQRLPRILRSNKAAEAFQHAFELIGGVPRLALWADRNPDKFFPLLARMIPATIAPVIPSDITDAASNPFPWVTQDRIRAMGAIEVSADIKGSPPNVVPMVPPPQTGT